MQNGLPLESTEISKRNNFKKYTFNRHSLQLGKFTLIYLYLSTPCSFLYESTLRKGDNLKEHKRRKNDVKVSDCQHSCLLFTGTTALHSPSLPAPEPSTRLCCEWAGRCLCIHFLLYRQELSNHLTVCVLSWERSLVTREDDSYVYTWPYKNSLRIYHKVEFMLQSDIYSSFFLCIFNRPFSL